LIDPRPPRLRLPYNPQPVALLFHGIHTIGRGNPAARKRGQIFQPDSGCLNPE
jgi:hypothetical protein